MTALTKADFLNIINNAITPESTEIEGVGTVFIKKLTVAEQKNIHNKCKDDNIDLSLHIIAHAVCDEAGNRIFDDKDIKTLGNMDTTLLTKLSAAIGEVLNPDSVEDAKKN